MAGLDEGSFSTGISKKRIIGVILIAVLLFSTFTFAITIFSTIFNTKRLDPNDNLENAPEEDPTLTTPPIPWNLEDLLEFFQDLNQTPNVDLTQEEMEDLAEEYQNMIDGSIDDIDLSAMAGLIGAYLFSDEEVFRIYEYDNISTVQGNLWKYESFDEYTGTSWECNSPLKDYPFYSYSNYNSKHSSRDMFNISMPLSPDQEGLKSFVLPNLFPRPYIMRNSVTAPNINSGETKLMKTGFNSTTLTLDFTSTGDVNMSYELFGAKLPSYDELNDSAVDSDYSPDPIKDQFLQLPPDISTYIDANPNFESHYNALNGIINNDDSATVVASKIRTYLENHFEFGTDALNNDPPADDEDSVEWFCEHEEGVWSDFVSAFCAFGRAFGLPTRYIDGYNSRYLEPLIDQNGNKAIPIMYRNIYNWAEIYVPSSTDGSGRWAQFDVCENISPYSGTIPGLNDYNISVSTNFTEGHRGVGNVANISATLTSINSSVSDKVITFEDQSMDTTIGEATTGANGDAWITVDIGPSQTIGAHYISAAYSSAINYTSYTVNGTDTSINLSLTSVESPVNISLDPTCRVQGSLVDPTTGNMVRYAIISQFYLFHKGSSTLIPNALNYDPINNPITTGDDGFFDGTLTLDSNLPSGEYEIRADFNGTWAGAVKAYGYINDSSNRVGLNITKEETYSVWLYIDDVEANNNTHPVVKRASTVELKAKLLNETGGAVPGETISFYDYSGTFIGENNTNSEGITTYPYYMDTNVPAGPNKINAEYGSFQNSSYFVLNAPINFDPQSFPTPREISKFDSYFPYEFNIQGQLLDNYNNPIKHSYFSVDMLDAGSPTGYLSWESGSYSSDGTGNIYINHSVLDSTPSKNYTLRVSFNGYFNYPGSEPSFDLTSYTNFTSIENGTYDLKVYDPSNIDILFRINGTDTEPFYDDSTLPQRYNDGEDILFAVDISQSSIPVTTDTVYFYDVDQGNRLIKSHQFDGTESIAGHYNFTVDTDDTGWNAGIHQIRVTWSNYGVYNSTYIIINKTATISLDQSALNVQRGTEDFIISGSVSDEGDALRGLEVGIHLYDSSNQDVSDNFNYAFGTSQNITINDDETFSFNLNSIDMDLSQGQYTIRIEFNGTIYADGISLSNYMVHFSSDPINLDLIAGTEILQQDYYTLEYEDKYPDLWVDTDTLIVVGNLTWDNNTGIKNMIINVTIEYVVDGSIVAYNDTVRTDQYGGFNVSLYIDDSWPTYRDDTNIIVDFDSVVNGLEYTDSTTKQFT